MTTGSAGNSSEPRVTVGVPVYNGEAYLEGALRSIQGQALGAIEILVSDNASTDATPEIARRLAAEDPRIQLVLQLENRGAASTARNPQNPVLRQLRRSAAARDRAAGIDRGSAQRRIHAAASHEANRTRETLERRWSGIG